MDVIVGIGLLSYGNRKATSGRIKNFSCLLIQVYDVKSGNCLLDPIPSKAAVAVFYHGTRWLDCIAGYKEGQIIIASITYLNFSVPV